MRELPKYVIECQHCKESLTITFGTQKIDPDFQKKVKDHLVFLMQKHFENDPDGLMHSTPPTEIRKWIKTVKPWDAPEELITATL